MMMSHSGVLYCRGSRSRRAVQHNRTCSRSLVNWPPRDSNITFMNGACVPYLEVAIKTPANRIAREFIPHLDYTPPRAPRNYDVTATSHTLHIGIRTHTCTQAVTHIHNTHRDKRDVGSIRAGWRECAFRSNARKTTKYRIFCVYM